MQKVAPFSLWRAAWVRFLFEGGLAPYASLTLAARGSRDALGTPGLQRFRAVDGCVRSETRGAVAGERLVPPVPQAPLSHWERHVPNGACGLQRVAQQAGDGHGADTARDGGDVGGVF